MAKDLNSLFSSSKRKTPELINDPQINRFMKMGPTWYNVPNVTTDYGEELVNSMIA